MCNRLFKVNAFTSNNPLHFAIACYKRIPWHPYSAVKRENKMCAILIHSRQSSKCQCSFVNEKRGSWSELLTVYLQFEALFTSLGGRLQCPCNYKFLIPSRYTLRDSRVLLTYQSAQVCMGWQGRKEGAVGMAIRKGNSLVPCMHLKGLAAQQKPVLQITSEA